MTREEFLDQFRITDLTDEQLIKLANKMLESVKNDIKRKLGQYQKGEYIITTVASMSMVDGSHKFQKISESSLKKLHELFKNHDYNVTVASLSVFIFVFDLTAPANK